MLESEDNGFVPPVEVRSVSDYVARVLADTRKWRLIPGCSPWFRGQSDSSKPPTPGILRQGANIRERQIVERFRKLAQTFGKTPPRDMLDEWLYLMQHVGVPTRLLDWSEGALIGLYFAVHNASPKSNPGVWVVHPLELNCSTLQEEKFPDASHPAFVARCDIAFGLQKKQPGNMRWPIAIIPTYTHPRMRSQKGCFTLHGSSSRDVESLAWDMGLVERGFFKKYTIPYDCASKMLRDLRTLGITHSTLFPDHDGLAIDLKNAFREERNINPNKSTGPSS